MPLADWLKLTRRMHLTFHIIRVSKVFLFYFFFKKLKHRETELAAPKIIPSAASFFFSHSHGELLQPPHHMAPPTTSCNATLPSTVILLDVALNRQPTHQISYCLKGRLRSNHDGSMRDDSADTIRRWRDR
jgi:hypothetical protein